MAKKTEQNNKNIIVGICMALIIVAIIIVAIVLITKNTQSTLNDSFFTTDGTKYVLNLDTSQFSIDNDNFQPTNAHLVYYHSGDTITDMKFYYEYSNKDDAKAAYEYYKANQASDYQAIDLNDKYLILTALPADFENITAYDIEQQIEFIKSNNATKSSEDNSPDVKESTSEEATETVPPVPEEVVEEAAE